LVELPENGRAAIACKHAAARDDARSAERQLAENLCRSWSAKQLESEHQALQRADSGASQLAVAAHAGEASGEEASGERRGADAQEDGRWHHISPVVEQAEADGGGKRQREM